MWHVNLALLCVLIVVLLLRNSLTPGPSLEREIDIIEASLEGYLSATKEGLEKSPEGSFKRLYCEVMLEMAVETAEQHIANLRSGVISPSGQKLQLDLGSFREDVEIFTSRPLANEFSQSVFENVAFILSRFEKQFDPEKNYTPNEIFLLLLEINQLTFVYDYWIQVRTAYEECHAKADELATKIEEYVYSSVGVPLEDFLLEISYKLRAKDFLVEFIMEGDEIVAFIEPELFEQARETLKGVKALRDR